MRMLLAAWLLLWLMAGIAGAAVAAPAEGPKARVNERIWADESIYFVMIDRFHNGDPANDGLLANREDPRAWHGGDLQGLIEKLDYIKSLGFTAIWITPHVKNAGRDYHGYGAVDFLDTDPHFGTVEKTAEFVKKAHGKGLKVIFDIVVNHTGSRNPLVAERSEWFNPKCSISNWSDIRQVENCWIFDLPDFDQSKPEVRDYILKYSRFWIEKTGVDGFRLDTVKHVPKDFFTWYSAELQKIKPGFWLLGEVWHSSAWMLSVYQEAGVTALLDFPASEAAREVFARDRSMAHLARKVHEVATEMADPWQMAAFLDNHDMPRFVSHAPDDAVQRLKLGLVWLFSQRSIPIVYYGTEIAMPGGGDPYNRDDFPWGNEPDTDVREWVIRLNRIRQGSLALRRGTVEELLAEKWQYAYARTYETESAVVVLNNHASEPFRTEVPVSAADLADGTVLTDALTGARATVTGSKLQVALGPRSGAIFLTERSRRAADSWWWAAVGAGAGAAGLGGYWALRRLTRRA